jgi:hypothetical protein
MDTQSARRFRETGRDDRGGPVHRRAVDGPGFPVSAFVTLPTETFGRELIDCLGAAWRCTGGATKGPVGVSSIWYRGLKVVLLTSIP